MKKILFISPQPFFQWRGSPIRVNFNIIALTELGYKIDLLTLPIGEHKEYEHCSIIRVTNPLGIRNIPIGPSLAKIFFDVLLFCKGVTLCIKNKYDVIHGVEEAGIIGVVLAKCFRAKSIFEKHSDPFSYRKGFLKNCLLSLYALTEKLTVRLSDAVIGTGKGLVSQVEKMGYPTRAFHIFDIPSSREEPSMEMVDRKRHELIKNHGEVLVTFVGSFALYQGVDLMFATIPEVAKKESLIRFIIIGGKGDEIDEKLRMLAQLEVEKSVTFLGKVPPDTLPEYLFASDILLSPRISGMNTPLKILDYMKAGKPIMATDVPSHRLLLDETVAVFASPEPEQLAIAIHELAGDTEKRKKMGAAGRRLYETKYNFDNYRHQLSACYQYVLSH
ncbi:MAG: glycosyltransferase family 4 protein [Deltaproteobacteria bacterium]|nr:glycosyltransferase family 4 protein [Deltaproteobacteria bacterium]